MSEKYGIVVDSGSSGSRIHIYKWDDSSQLQRTSTDPYILNSVPRLVQEEGWTSKTSPGLSSFSTHPKDVWDKHFEPLIEFAEKIIPASKHHDTEIFVQATAGMRLVPQKQRDKVLNEVCKSLKEHSPFKISSCQENVQVIDGETEGLYGWIGLNYLKGTLNGYDASLTASEHESYGFMDMGGASTQISFVPSSEEEIKKHSDDLYNVVLRNVNGQAQQWPVFVSTWLGFGANEARKRHLKNLIFQLPEGVNYDRDGDNKYDLIDPCAPRGMIIEETLNGIVYEITGSGDYQMCMKNVYPLLLKNLPCKDDPCLFNGVHAPTLDFRKDKFVGVSEYWYTANDVFHMGGEYNFLKFEERLKEFCETEWTTIEKKWNNKDYGKFITSELLRDSCFKASWVVNVLHEGFGLPRLGLDTDYLNDDDIKDLNDSTDKHIPFQSANLIDGAELSWTVGKMLLIASNQVPSNGQSSVVGIIPSEQSQMTPQSRTDRIPAKDYDSLSSFPFFGIFFFSIVGMVVYLALTKKIIKSASPIKRGLTHLHLEQLPSCISDVCQKTVDATKHFYYCKVATGESSIVYQENVLNSSLEEGLVSNSSNKSLNTFGSLRTRSTMNLSDQADNSGTRSVTSGNSSPLLNPSLYSVNERQSMPVLPTLSTKSEFMGKKFNKYVSEKPSFGIGGSALDLRAMKRDMMKTKAGE